MVSVVTAGEIGRGFEIEVEPEIEPAKVFGCVDRVVLAATTEDASPQNVFVAPLAVEEEVLGPEVLLAMSYHGY